MTAPVLHVHSRRHPYLDLLVRVSPVALWLIVAWWIYQPAEARPFDYVDFPENLTLLRDHDGLMNGVQALNRVYADHGRWSPLTMLSWAGQWSIFGWWAPGWHLTRFAIMAVVVTLAYSLWRRIGLGLAGAFVATSLLVVSPAAIPAWIRPSSAEPLAMLWLVAACHVAFRAPTVPSNLMLAALLVATMWTKELAVAAFAFPVLLALSAGGSHVIGAPRLDRPRLVRLGYLAVAFLVGSVPILWTFLKAPDGAFATRYAAEGVALINVVGGALAAMLPFAPVPADSPVQLGIVSVVFLLLVITGWIVAFRATSRAQSIAVLALAVLVPLLGGVVYAPWPFYLLIYALPFALAGSILPGQAASALVGSSSAIRVVGLTGLTTVLTFSVLQAANESARTRAIHVAFARTVTHVAAIPGLDSVMVEVDPAMYDARGNFGPRFLMYAWMRDLEWPDARDVPCDQGIGLRQPRIRFNVMCPLPASSAQIVVRYRRFTWPNPVPRPDSVAVSISPAG